MPWSSSRLITGNSTTPSGIGLVAMRRQAPAPSLPTARPASRMRAASLSDSGWPIGLVGSTERRIVAIDQRLGDDGDDFALHSGRGEGVLQGLLEHVPDPARRLRHQHSQRQRLRHLPGRLVPQQLVADLGTVAVHDDNPPSLPGQLYDRRDTLARMPELIGYRGRLIRARQRVAAERQHRGAQRLPTGWDASKLRTSSNREVNPARCAACSMPGRTRTSHQS